MFEVGGYVTYRAEGVCVIRDIRQERFGEAVETYYVLSPLNDPRSTIFVPLQNQRLLDRMKPLLSPEDLVAMAKETAGERIPWQGDSRARNTVWREILSEGDTRQLMVMLHTIRAHEAEETEKGVRVTGIDLTAKAKGERLLLDQCSMTTNLTEEEQIDRMLRGELIPCGRDEGVPVS